MQGFIGLVDTLTVKKINKWRSRLQIITNRFSLEFNKTKSQIIGPNLNLFGR